MEDVSLNASGTNSGMHNSRAYSATLYTLAPVRNILHGDELIISLHFVQLQLYHSDKNPNKFAIAPKHPLRSKPSI